MRFEKSAPAQNERPSAASTIARQAGSASSRSKASPISAISIESKKLCGGRRIAGDEAVRIGLADLLVAQDEVRSAAQALALEIAQSAPLAVLATRETVRRGLIDAVEAATERELVEQDWLRRTEDFQEGIKAMADRRLPNFQGR